MLSSLRTKNNCEYDTKFIQDRILQTERNFAQLCNIFAQYSRKIARVRDKGDSIAEFLVGYAENEDVNKSLSVGLRNFATTLATVNDYGNSRVEHIDKKIVDEFSKYEAICKQAKDDVKQIFTVQDKELIKRKQCQRLRSRKTSSRQMIQAETELFKAKLDLTKAVSNIEDKIITFEKQKVHDVKAILLDFTVIEIGYHAKALELLTRAYKDINEADEDSDVQIFHETIIENSAEFKKSLRDTETTESPFKTSQSLASLNTDARGQKQSPGIPTPAIRKFKSEEILDISSESESEQDSSITTEKSTPKVTKKFAK